MGGGGADGLIFVLFWHLCFVGGEGIGAGRGRCVGAEGRHGLESGFDTGVETRYHSGNGMTLERLTSITMLRFNMLDYNYSFLPEPD